MTSTRLNSPKALKNLKSYDLRACLKSLFSGRCEPLLAPEIAHPNGSSDGLNLSGGSSSEGLNLPGRVFKQALKKLTKT